MDPSHARRYKTAEIEGIVSRLLGEIYRTGIRIPIDIDLIAENNKLVDNIFPVELLEDKFNVSAVLTCNLSGHFDILVDEDTLNLQRARASFSIAHELGHVSLHSQLCLNCHDIKDSIALRTRITRSYGFIERNANDFASAILMPRSTLYRHTSRLYEGLVKLYGYDFDLIFSKLCSRLAECYCVNLQPMKIRLNELKLQEKIQSALQYKSPYLDP